MRIIINGRKSLRGTVEISGAKNAALPELAAIVLSQNRFKFSHVPEVEDVKIMLRSLETIGADIVDRGDKVDIQLTEVRSGTVPREIVDPSRAPVLILGPLLARNGYAKVCLPGGCPIGERKINYHLEGLKAMGATVETDSQHIIAYADRLNGIEYSFPNKTVTGTENLLMAATLAQGTTVLHNCALEPEVSDLIDLLRQMGAEIEGKNSETLIIKGKSRLSGAEHKIIPDRIEMGTYVIAGCFVGNDIEVTNANPQYIGSLLDLINEIGIKVNLSADRIKIIGSDNLNPVEIETMPYPGFPTDLQAQLSTLLTQAKGTSIIKENIFDNRFKHTDELNKLGANIKVNRDVATITGRTELTGSTINATDLRASAALILGGLIADGETVVNNSYQLLRGYEKMPQKLRQMGGDIKLIKE